MAVFLKLLLGPLGKIAGVVLVAAAIFLFGYNSGKDSVNVKIYKDRIAAIELQLAGQQRLNDEYAERLAADQYKLRSLEDDLKEVEDNADDTAVCVVPDNTNRLRNIFEKHTLPAG